MERSLCRDGVTVEAETGLKEWRFLQMGENRHAHIDESVVPDTILPRCALSVDMYGIHASKKI